MIDFSGVSARPFFLSATNFEYRSCSPFHIVGRCVCFAFFRSSCTSTCVVGFRIFARSAAFAPPTIPVRRGAKAAAVLEFGGEGGKTGRAVFAILRNCARLATALVKKHCSQRTSVIALMSARSMPSIDL